MESLSAPDFEVYVPKNFEVGATSSEFIQFREVNRDASVFEVILAKNLEGHSEPMSEFQKTSLIRTRGHPF